jgi:hypothetical protein
MISAQNLIRTALRRELQRLESTNWIPSQEKPRLTTLFPQTTDEVEPCHSDGLLRALTSIVGNEIVPAKNAACTYDRAETKTSRV